MGLIDSIGKFADPYDRQARLYPALLALFPLAIAITIVFAQQAPILGNVAVAAAGCGLLYWMTGVARDRGKRLEAGLFRSWGRQAVDPGTAPQKRSDRSGDENASACLPGGRVGGRLPDGR